VTVDDADATVAKATELGASVLLSVHEVHSAGSMAIFTDPTGAAFSIWQPNEHAGAGLVNAPGSFCWNELITTDVSKATSFYADLFDWDYVAHDMPMGTYTEIKVGGRSNGGMMARPPQMAEVPPFWGVYFSVADCDEAVERVNSIST
jgi:predicted enzyme related to lactoylglutathione lyase